MLKWFISFCLLIGLTTQSHAEQLPRTMLDSRVQVFDYTADDVFVIRTKFGFGSLIQFEDGEFINDDGGLGMGEAKDWSIAVKGNNIFFKPLKEFIQPTNMIVVTNKRTYVFALYTDNENMTYVARFNYPKETVNEKQKQISSLKFKRVQQGNNVYLINANINTNYYKRGNIEIAPTSMWDDGLFTYLEYDNANDLPAVYKVMPDGSEMLVNSHIDEKILVLHEVNKLYRLRLGKAVVDLGSGMIAKGKFNSTGTSVENTLRVIQ